MTAAYPRSSSTYRLSVAHVLRILGPLMLVLGVAWVLVAITGVTGPVRGLLAGLTLVILGAGVVALLRPPRVLSLTAEGYRISLVRGAGASRSDWTEVESVGTQTTGGAPSLVFVLKGGLTSVVPLSLLGQRHMEAQREVHERLNTAYGYRRL